MKSNSGAHKQVITRFAPSPTGVLHIGSVRTALFNFLYAKQMGGKVILRSEDTDKERSKKEYEDNIIEGFKWLGLTFDEFYRQSERTAIYKEKIEGLIASGKAYISKEEPKEPGQRESVIRFKNPKTPITFHDHVRGDIIVDPSDLGDFVIARDIDDPLYHLAVVIDDLSMGVTHIIRGEDGIANTPRQILLIEALGGERPFYAHVPFILGKDKSKLSKRHGAVSVLDYRDQGYLPEAILNYMAMLGWSPQSLTGEVASQEIFSLDELVKLFSIDHLQKAPAVFNQDKLDWINKAWIGRMAEDDRMAHVAAYFPGKDPVVIKKIALIILERINRFGEITAMQEAGEFVFFFETPKYPIKLLLGKKGEYETGRTVRHLAKIMALLGDNTSWKETIYRYASEQAGRGEVLWPMRVALSGKERSPDPLIITEIIGTDEAIARINTAIKNLGSSHLSSH